MAFDSIQVRFRNTSNIDSPFADTRVVPFIGSYFEILKSVVEDVKTEHFWFFSNFVDIKNFGGIDLDFIPEQHEQEQIHVWYTTHPKGGLNKEGNVMLIPTAKFKEQMNELAFLRDFKDINYHAHATLFQRPIGRTNYQLKNPVKAYNAEKVFYKWMVNNDLRETALPNFYPSFWEDEKMYTWGKTKDIMLVPGDRDIKQFYDIDRSVHFDLEYETKPMDIVFLSYDEPSAEAYWKALKEKYPRAKRLQGVKGRTQAYHAAAAMSETAYFFAVFPTIEIDDEFDFTFQPDRLREACHYIFHCKNPVNGLEYGHRAVILYNKHLCLSTIHPSLDFTLSQPHTVVPQLCGTSHFNQTPEISWRVAFREVIKLCEMKPTVESKFRLKKWCELGKGNYALLVQQGALDAVEYYKEVNGDKRALMLSYELDWLKEKFNSIS
jgi:hypothetical protein|tara:strand:+ start:2004 stop:3311 length:1308 start_codon:yes stop_codon:yes gene_type:complete